MAVAVDDDPPTGRVLSTVVAWRVPPIRSRALGRSVRSIGAETGAAGNETLSE